jgi:hypothetical protein
VVEIWAARSKPLNSYVRHLLGAPAVKADVEVVEVGAARSKRLDPSVPDLPAFAEVEVVEVGTVHRELLDPTERQLQAAGEVDPLHCPEPAGKRL